MIEYLYSTYSYLLLATAIYPRLLLFMLWIQPFLWESLIPFSGEWASVLVLFFYFLRPKEVSSFFLYHTLYIFGSLANPTGPTQNVSKHDSCFPHPPSSPALPPLLWEAVMSPYSRACFHSCCSPASELCSLCGGRSKCFQTFHSSAQKASSAIQSCQDCLKRRAVAVCPPPLGPVPTLPCSHLTSHRRLSLPQTPQAHFRLRALALPAPGLYSPSSGPESSLLTAHSV